MMRTLILSVVLLPAMGATAQQAVAAAAPEGSNWQHVQALPVGSSIQVKARKSSAGCALKSVDADSLTCTHGKDVVFQRTDIVSIKIPRRGRSALIGTAIGGGTGAIIGFGVGTTGNSFFGKNAFRGAITGVFAALGGFAGAGIGAGTDSTRSTVYQAP